MRKAITYLDLFSGIGGFALGLQNTGVKIKKHYFSEIDTYATAVYKNHFPDAIGLGDVKTIKSFSKLGKIDLITFGFPCQDLSVAGKGVGFNGSRSSLFYEATRIIRATRPTHFIFENVKGLLSNDNGRTFEKVLQEIADIGLYDCEWQLVNTSWFLPQNRERIYFIGHLRGKSAPKVFPITDGHRTPVGIQRHTANTLTAGDRSSNGTYVVESQLVQKTKKHPQGERINLTNGNSVCLSANGGGFATRTGLYAVDVLPILTPDRINKSQNGRRFKTSGEPSFTLTTQDRHGVLIIPRDSDQESERHICIRKLTPTECERLQGFPDGWTSGYSDNQRYKMLGNAVSVPVPEYVFNKLYKNEKNRTTKTDTRGQSDIVDLARGRT